MLTNNIIVGSNSRDFGRRNFYPVSIRQVGFINYRGGNLSLKSNSPYRNKGFGGKQVGANLNPELIGGR